MALSRAVSRGLGLAILCAALLGPAAIPPASAQSTINGLSTWTPGSKRPADTTPSTPPKKKSSGRSKKLALHASTIADVNISKERRGVYKSINRAIRHTAPNGLVTVNPGFYNEHLDIDWPVQISGRVRVGHNIPGAKKNVDDAVDKVVVRPPSGKGCATINVKAGETVDLRDLWFHLGAGSTGACIQHKKGELLISGALIETHDRAPAVVLSGEQAMLELNEIRGGLVGVYIAPSGGFSTAGSRRYSINRNTLSGHDVGINIDAYGASVYMRGNKVEKNRQAGVMMSKGDIVAIENKIEKNEQDGVVILYPNTARLIGNDLIGNKRYGLYMPIATTAQLEDNFIGCNGKGGIAPSKGDEAASADYPGNIIDHNPPTQKRRLFGRGRAEEACKDYIPKGRRS